MQAGPFISNSNAFSMLKSMEHRCINPFKQADISYTSIVNSAVMISNQFY